MHFILFYEFAPDYLERRAAHRDQHLQLAWQSQERGELILAGALAEPPDGAILVFECDSRAVPEQFAEADPYVIAGLVTRWRVRQWTTVVGKDSSTPVRPAR
jgi:uncharacterized protein YciI